MSRPRLVAVAIATVLAIVVAGGIAWTVTSAGQRGEIPVVAGEASDPGVASRGDGPSTAEMRGADELSAEFLADWVDDGRVVRRDQGGDTVSEGQAYGMLIALGAGDEESFDAIWSWTREHLQRPDGLLAWRWDDGAIVDDEPASDGDLDVARALVLAGDRFDRPDLADQGNEHAALILDRLTVQTALGRILLPGEWAAAAEPYAYNPSYASPAAFAVLAASTGDARWDELAAGSAAATTAVLDSSELPPDWAQVHADGKVDAMPGPAGRGSDVRYSYDAARLPLRYAESCTATDVALAARLAPALTRDAELRSELDLGGGALGEAVHPLAYGARAASLAASGDADAARDDLDEAVSVLDASPTYYGAAWAALAPLLLETQTLGACPPLTEER